MNSYSNLEQQIDELEFLQSMYSAPGEFRIEDQGAYQHALAYTQRLTPDTPKVLSSSLHILINAHQDSEDEEEAPQAVSAAAIDEPLQQYDIHISIRTPNR